MTIKLFRTAVVQFSQTLIRQYELYYESENLLTSSTVYSFAKPISVQAYLTAGKDLECDAPPSGRQ